MIDINMYISDVYVSSLGPEETININHFQCSDTRGRLYITRKERVYVAYCHNCGDRGVLSAAAYYEPSALLSSRATKLLDSTASISLPTGLMPLDSSKSYWADIALLNAAGTQYDPSSTRYIIPVYEKLDLAKGIGYGYKGYIARRVYQRQIPKYLNYLPPNFKGYQFVTGDAAKLSNSLVIVEDTISAVAVALAGYNSVCLFGAKHTIEKLHAIANDSTLIDTIYVWYDNDNKEVDNSSNLTKEYLSLLGHTVVKIPVQNEPKKLTTSDIVGVINTWKK